MDTGVDTTRYNTCFHGITVAEFWKHCGSKRGGTGAYFGELARKPIEVVAC